MALASFLGFVILIGQGNTLEKNVADLSGSAAMLVALGVAVVLARQRSTAKANSPDGTPQFEEFEDPAILPLGLSQN